MTRLSVRGVCFPAGLQAGRLTLQWSSRYPLEQLRRARGESALSYTRTCNAERDRTLRMPYFYMHRLTHRTEVIHTQRTRQFSRYYARIRYCMALRPVQRYVCVCVCVPAGKHRHTGGVARSRMIMSGPRLRELTASRAARGRPPACSRGRAAPARAPRPPPAPQPTSWSGTPRRW